MKIIFGIILLVIFILAVSVIAFAYVFAVNNNIDNMLKKKGFKNYRNYKNHMKNKSRRINEGKIVKAKYSASESKSSNKKIKKEEKREVEEYLYYELSQRRKKD